jgi:chorismate synthase
MTSQFGERFHITTFGESHGQAVGVVIDGCPPNVSILHSDIQSFLDRRRPGQSQFTTARAEADRVEILSGVFEEKSLGSPIALMVRNADQRSQDYAQIESVYRPSHADFTTEAKYGIRAAAGGGRSSARETIGRVAAGAIARKVCLSLFPAMEVFAWVDRVQDISASVDPLTVSLESVEASPIRCPDVAASRLMEERILAVKGEGDTIGGTVAFVVRGVPPGLGEPVLDKFEATLAAGLMSLPASKSFEIGSGLAGTFFRGSEHNDAFEMKGEKVTTRTNHSGGIQGGITNGMPITGVVGFKPVSTIFKPQDSVSSAGKNARFQLQGGRHDPCVLPRAVPMVEAMIWLTLVEHLLRQRALTGRTDGYGPLSQTKNPPQG